MSPESQNPITFRNKKNILLVSYISYCLIIIILWFLKVYNAVGSEAKWRAFLGMIILYIVFWIIWLLFYSIKRKLSIEYKWSIEKLVIIINPTILAILIVMYLYTFKVSFFNLEF